MQVYIHRLGAPRGSASSWLFSIGTTAASWLFSIGTTAASWPLINSMIAENIGHWYGAQPMAAVGIPDDDGLYRAMYLANPWWEGRRMRDGTVREFRRPDYAKLMRRIGDHPVHAVLGARQVGKTTLLYQVVADLVDGGDPRRVVFLPLDELGLFPSADNLRRMLDLYGLRTLGESMHDLAGETYVILDEVQAIANWQRAVKAVVDRRGPLTFVVSGSSSAGTFERSESLAGRVRHQVMGPMSFCECLRFGSHAHAAAAARAGAGLREALARSVESGSPEAFHDRARDAMLELAPAQDGLKIRLSEYMLYGGLPGIAASGDPAYRVGELKRAISMSMYDIVKAGNVRSPRALEGLFYMLAEGSPRLINKDRMLGSLGINRATLDAYLRLLEAAYLLSYSPAYSPGSSAGVRAQKKAYVNDAGIRNAVLSRNDARTLSDPTEAGMLAETVAFSHTRRLWASLDLAAMSYMPHYGRTGGKGDGVGLVMSLHRRPVPIEVKYRQHVDAADVRGLRRFVGRFKPGVALAITQDRVRLVDDVIVAIPLWLYLVMCG